MRTRLFAFFILISPALCWADRPTMTGPPPEDEAIRDLVDLLSESCSKKNFRAYMDCFTPKAAETIKKSAENAFICYDMKLDVLESFVISADEETITFGLKYDLSEGSSRKTICSKVVAKRYDSGLKIDSEQIRDIRIAGARIASALQVRPALQINANVQPCANGQCPPPRPNPIRTFPNPANGGEEAWLPKDIGYTPGPSCANGNCAVR